MITLEDLAQVLYTYENVHPLIQRKRTAQQVSTLDLVFKRNAELWTDAPRATRALFIERAHVMSTRLLPAATVTCCTAHRETMPEDAFPCCIYCPGQQAAEAV